MSGISDVPATIAIPPPNNTKQNIILYHKVYSRHAFSIVIEKVRKKRFEILSDILQIVSPFSQFEKFDLVT